LLQHKNMHTSATGPLLQDKFIALRCCVLLPTFNNAGTLEQVIRSILSYTNRLIVVNDGSTDKTEDILDLFPGLIVIRHSVNQGKGMALRNGLEAALKDCNRYAISIDSDGQHFPSELGVFLHQVIEEPDSLIIGARNLKSDNVPSKSSFGNSFSNFWFRIETGIQLPDTQSGYRLYPVEKMNKMRFLTKGFEFEIEVIVKAAWKGIPILSVPVQVYYAPPAHRISHFKPGRDFLRISLLNTYLVVWAFLWYKPIHILSHLRPSNMKAFLKRHFFNPAETPLRKSMAVALGVFFGILPIWGIQLATALVAAILLKLNKAIVAVSANISVPPMIPIILFASVKTGEWITGHPVHLQTSGLTIDLLKANAYNFYVYLAGATVLSVIAAVLAGSITYGLLLIPTRKRTTKVQP
jgi:glycosyltransferase involved in cell wall biosynthesis